MNYKVGDNIYHISTKRTGKVTAISTGSPYHVIASFGSKEELISISDIEKTTKYEHLTAKMLVSELDNLLYDDSVGEQVALAFDLPESIVYAASLNPVTNSVELMYETKDRKTKFACKKISVENAVSILEKLEKLQTQVGE